MRRTQANPTVAVALGMGLIAAALPTLVHACAVCAGSSPEDAGYFWGVLFLMVMPFSIAGLVGGWLLFQFRRARPGLIALAPTVIVEKGSHGPPAIAPASAGLHDGVLAIRA